jgi:hypothetical protein
MPIGGKLVLKGGLHVTASGVAKKHKKKKKKPREEREADGEDAASAGDQGTHIACSDCRRVQRLPAARCPAAGSAAASSDRVCCASTYSYRIQSHELI